MPPGAPLAIDVRHHRHVVRPDDDMKSASGTGRKWVRARRTALNSRPFMCQARCLPDQTPRRPPHPEREASVITIWRWYTTPIRTPLRRKLGSHHTKRARRQAPDTLSRQRDGQEGRILRDFIHQRNASYGNPYHAKACNRHAGPLDDACESYSLPPLGVKMSCMYEVGVTNWEPAGAIISPMTTTAHGPKTSDIVR